MSTTGEFPLVRSMPPPSLQWPICGSSTLTYCTKMSLKNILFSSQPHFTGNIVHFVKQIFHSANRPLLSHFLSVLFFPFPCLHSMMESQLWNMAVNMTLLFPDCVRIGTLTHTLKNVLPSCGCLTIGRRVFMYVHVHVYSAMELCHFPQKENTGEHYYSTTTTTHTHTFCRRTSPQPLSLPPFTFSCS